MLLQPKDLYAKLEFDKILEATEKECYGALGREAVLHLPLETDAKALTTLLLEVKEMKTTFEKNERFILTTYEDTAPDLKMLAIEGYVLPVEGLQRLNIALLIVRDIFSFFTTARQSTYTNLYNILRPYTFDFTLLKAIQRVIDEKGEFRADASPELQRIRRMMGSKQKELDEAFRRTVGIYRAKGWLTDSVETLRNGRRVLSVPSEHKRKIRGIIHDESTTGRTAYIEPEEIIEINNDIFDLDTDERREIYRILRDLSAVLRPYIQFMTDYRDIVVRFDVIHAKARLAMRLRANMPQVRQEPRIAIKKGFHPLLLLRNQTVSKKTVPFDMIFFEGNHVLVLSGPNAGGKSITMKSVGLLQLMLQAGMLIPVDPTSEMGIFKNIFADIGDQQSLEDDLSTYSSHLRNMRAFTEAANEETLILIDEFGSGTDPKIGGAIAEAILEDLQKKKTWAVITTHYSNLKIYAFDTKGIVNGSMTFDKDNLQPTYEFRMGRPGSSYAFEIAQSSGLSKSVLQYAKGLVGENEKAVDQLLVDLQRERQELEEKLKSMSQREKKLEQLIKSYEDLHKDLDFKRKRLKLDIKEFDLQQTANETRALEKLLKELRDQKSVQKVEEVVLKVREEKKQAVQKIEELTKELYYKPTEAELKKSPLQVGDVVKMRAGSATGTIESINKSGDAVVQVGFMRMKLKIADLQHAPQHLEMNRKLGIQLDTIQLTAAFDNKIDVRGMRREEVLRMIDEFVDKAIMANAKEIRILHGKGDGVLRLAVKQKLREFKAVTNIRHPEPNDGGDGVTLASIV